MVIPKHILGTFDEALTSLRNDLLMMAGLAERSLDRALKGLLQRDDVLCANAIADDEEIDQLEKQIDKDGLEILLRFQPVASDLRRVISDIKLSPNIERVGDQATNIAKRARKLNRNAHLPEVQLSCPCKRTQCRCSRIASTHMCVKMSSWHTRSAVATKHSTR